jgi:tRNA (guanine37-N1)-methyltransferase
MSVWTATVLTLFPDMFPGFLGHSLPGTALSDGKWALEARDIRDQATDRHRSVDDTPFGGGPGMVMRADIVDAALNSADSRNRPEIYLSPRGRRLDQAMVEELASGDGVVLVCGRYEGLDERVIEARGMQEVSLGDFILSGGEGAAMSLIDACVRLLPGVLGAPESLAEESFQTGLLEYPQYTRPAEWRGRAVPEVLLSGHHDRIQHWRLAQAQKTTRKRRVDLWSQYVAGLNEARVSS